MSLLAGLSGKRDDVELERATARILDAFEGTVELDADRPAA